MSTTDAVIHAGGLKRAHKNTGAHVTTLPLVAPAVVRGKIIRKRL